MASADAGVQARRSDEEPRVRETHPSTVSGGGPRAAQRSGKLGFDDLFGGAGGPESGRQHFKRLLSAVRLSDYVARVEASRTAAHEGLPFLRASVCFESGTDVGAFLGAVTVDNP